MEIVKILTVYILSPWIISLCGALFFWSLLLLGKKIKNFGGFFRPLVFIISVLSNILAVFIIVKLCNIFDIKPQIFMIIFSGGWSFLNNLNRYNLTKTGKSRAETLAYLSDQNAVFDRGAAVKQEIVHIVGDIAGLILGVISFF